jgi:hypothetical protein
MRDCQAIVVKSQELEAERKSFGPSEANGGVDWSAPL